MAIIYRRLRGIASGIKCKFTGLIYAIFLTRVLYITYDGLTDPLGQSQILPYLAGLSQLDYRFTIVSLEKPEAYNRQKDQVQALLQKNNITWEPLVYDTTPGLKAKMANDRRLKKKVMQLIANNPPALLHARSYPASLIAMRASRRHNLPFVFDMRGFWADERVEGKIWNLKKLHHRLLYRYFKKKEKELLQKSAHVVSLTQAAKDYMCTHFAPYVSKNKIAVIPCCADLDHFTIRDKNTTGREALNIGTHQKVLVYLGSVGTWYLLEEMIAFFKVFAQRWPDAVFLLMTPHDHEKVKTAFEKQQVNAEAYRIVSATRNEVPAYIACADTAVFFVRPSFSKTASSPVKLAELMGSGLPVFANTGIGDMDYHAKETNALHLITQFDTATYTAILDDFATQEHFPEKARAFALRNYSLEKGIERYRNVYEKVLKKA